MTCYLYDNRRVAANAMSLVLRLLTKEAERVTGRLRFYTYLKLPGVVLNASYLNFYLVYYPATDLYALVYLLTMVVCSNSAITV